MEVSGYTRYHVDRCYSVKQEELHYIATSKKFNFTVKKWDRHYQLSSPLIYQYCPNSAKGSVFFPVDCFPSFNSFFPTRKHPLNGHVCCRRFMSFFWPILCSFLGPFYVVSWVHYAISNVWPFPTSHLSVKNNLRHVEWWSKCWKHFQIL